MRPIFALSLSLALLPGLASPAHADLVFETESNDTFATANKTIGLNNLGVAGSFTLGDIDVFSFYITPNPQGMARFELTAFWSAGSTQPPL